MMLYTDMDQKNTPKISLGAVKFLAKQLKEFIELYEKKILLQTPEEIEKFNKLKEISRLLNNEDYHLLIADPFRYIDFTDDDEEYLPDWFPY